MSSQKVMMKKSLLSNIINNKKVLKIISVHAVLVVCSVLVVLLDQSLISTITHIFAVAQTFAARTVRPMLLVRVTSNSPHKVFSKILVAPTGVHMVSYTHGTNDVHDVHLDIPQAVGFNVFYSKMTVNAFI